MKSQVDANGALTLNEVRAMVQGVVNTDEATMEAFRFQQTALKGRSREFVVAVFLSGLASNLLLMPGEKET